MFDPNRTFISCVLCNASAPLTREHIYGAGLLRRSPKMPNRNGFDLRNIDPRNPKRINGGAPMLGIVSKILCRECNHSFHGVMSRSLGPLSGLILGTANKLSAAEVCDVRRYFERLGFFMDILTSNHQITPEYAARPEHQRVAHFRTASPVFSQDEREAWMSLVVTERKPKVYIGRHLGVLGVNPDPQTGHESLKTAGVDGLRAASLKSQIVIGQLAVFIAMDSVAATPSDAFTQLGSEELPWPATRDVDYEDYLQLLGKPNLNWCWREALKTAASRRRLEHDFRKSQGRCSSAFIRLGLETGLKRDRSGGS